MRRLALVGLASLSTALCGGIFLGCGDNQAARPTDAGKADADGAVTDGTVTDVSLDGTDVRLDVNAGDGRDAGDAGDGGNVGDGVDAGNACTGVNFVTPAAGAVLVATDDASGDACATGFQYTVVVTVPTNGATVELLGTMGATVTSIGTVTSANGEARFTNITLAQGATDLSVKVAGTTCSAVRSVTVDCSLPIVTIVAPLSDGPPFADQSRRLLAATAAQPFKDLDAAMAGAQTNVVACTNKSGSSRLFAGHVGDAMLVQVGVAVNTAAAVLGDNCPSGLSFVARFTGVTLPESTESATGALTSATEISVNVTEGAATAVTGSSDPTDLWVDSTAPTISERTPTPLCGSMQNGNPTFTTDVTLNSSTANVTLSVTNSSMPAAPVTFGPPTYAAGVATFTAVAFPLDVDTVVATATEPSGNSTTLAPPVGMASCTVTVGQSPVVTFVTPTNNAKLCANGNSAGGCLPDSDIAVAGWQNDITVHATAGGAPLTTGSITFTINGGAPVMVLLNASGNATLSNATVPEGLGVIITAATDNVPSFGVGTASISVTVDTLPPSAPVGLTATPLDRRQTSFTLTWTAPGDPGHPTVDSYDIHVKLRDPVTGDPCGREVGAVPFTVTPVVPMGSSQSMPVSSLFIETDYCFTVAATDTVGNISPAANVMGRANFMTTLLPNPSAAIEDFGFFTDGTADFGAPGAGGFANDTLSDLLAGTLVGQNAYIFFGRPGGFVATPDVTFTGPASQRFGATVVNAGDLDGDDLADIAIGSPGLVATDPAFVYIFSRKNAPWAVNGGWPSNLTAAQASYVITAGATYNGAFFGFSMARLGNFDGVGRDDLAIGATSYNGPAGAGAGRVVIVKGSLTFASITLPDPTNTIVIDGEAAGDRFGRTMEILADNTLVVSATNASASAGKLYAFRSPLVATQTANAATAFDISVSGIANSQYGLTLSTLGPLGSSAAAVVVGAVGAGGNFVDVHMPAAADGTFGGAVGSIAVPSVHFISSTTAAAFGATNIGRPALGVSAKRSLIGNDTVPDLVIAGQSDPTNPIYIVNGANLASFTGTVDLATSNAPGIVILRNKLPAAWTAYGSGSFVLDLDGDNYSDFVLGESGTTKPGRALVFW